MTTLWFACIALLGIRGIAMQPEVLYAVNPWYAFEFFLRESWHGAAVLAAVVLVITGGEALYADMGHFGPRPIRLAWFAVVLPALVLNYFGQGAWLLEHPDALLGETFNPFFGLVPEWGLYPMIVIATAAAVVASQALISGAFSLTQQAIQLGFVPRMRIIHTSISEKGQIYMPGINWALWAACIGLVIALPSSTKLAATYGVAVTGAMLTTTLLFAIVMRRLWHWPMWRVIAITTVFALVDAAFLGANLLKIGDGGWFPIVVAACVYLLMSTWKKGRRQITAILRESSLPLDLFVPDIGRKKVQRVAGTAVFMTSIPNVASPVLLHHLKHNKVLHERVIMVTVEGAEIPTIPEEERVTVEAKGEGFYQVIATYGFTESPDVPALLLAVGENLRQPGDTTRRKLRMHKDNTTLVDGKGKEGDIQGRIGEIRGAIDKSTSDYDREKLQERLAKLSGGVAVINVGAATETEMKEKKARVEDALHATRAAVEEGIVPGGGVALIRAQHVLDKVKGTTDEKIGVDIVRRAIEEPIRAIAINAGVEGSIVLAKVKESKEKNFGYNAGTDNYEDMVKAGVIDPTKVTRTALQNAASIAGLLLTTECVVTERKEENKGGGAPAGGGGGMGGMY